MSNISSGVKRSVVAPQTQTPQAQAPVTAKPATTSAPVTAQKKPLELQAVTVSQGQLKQLSTQEHKTPALSGPSKGAGVKAFFFAPECIRKEGEQASVGLNCTTLYKKGDKLPMLTGLPRELAVLQKSINSAFEKDPKTFVDSYAGMAAAAGKPGEPVTFSPDDAKGALMPEQWLGTGTPMSEDVKKFRSSGANAVLHQAGHACAQMAFVQKLDELKNLPDGDPKKSVLVTNGGCGAGKGYALKTGLSGEFKNRFGAVWDAAGEQCTLDNQWVLKEAAKRGIKTTLVYVHAEPEVAFDRAVTKRFQEEGRLVNTQSFAESYVDGAKNMRALVGQLKDSGQDVELVVVHNKNGEKPVPFVFGKDELGKAASQLDTLMPQFAQGLEGVKHSLESKIPADLPAYAKTGLSILD